MPRALPVPITAGPMGPTARCLSVPSRMAFEESQLKSRGLIALPIAEKIGFILVHPDPEGRLDFDEFMGEMQDVLAGYNFADLRLVSEYRAPARINWKHAVDGGGRGLSRALSASRDGRADDAEAVPQSRFRNAPEPWSRSGPTSPSCAICPNRKWPEFCNFSVSNAIFPNTVIGGGELIAFFQRSEPGDEPGTCTYIFRTYGWGRNASDEILARDKQIADLLLKVALDEDMKVQSSSQIMMEAGAVPSVIFGKREQNLVRMHKNYDRILGHDAAKALAAGR